jgi:hypothetical protein
VDKSEIEARYKETLESILSNQFTSEAFKKYAIDNLERMVSQQLSIEEEFIKLDKQIEEEVKRRFKRS